MLCARCCTHFHVEVDVDPEVDSRPPKAVWYSVDGVDDESARFGISGLRLS